MLLSIRRNFVKRLPGTVCRIEKEHLRRPVWACSKVYVEVCRDGRELDTVSEVNFGPRADMALTLALGIGFFDDPECQE